MSTQGFYAFVIDGTTKVVHVRGDAYPSFLGQRFLDWARGADLDKAADQVRALRIIQPEDTITDAMDEAFSNLPHGDIQAQLDLGYTADDSAFPHNSLWAEWGYVVDFDEWTFEIHKGFQDRPHRSGRFASAGQHRTGYWPVRLIATHPLAQLPERIGIEEDAS